MQLPHGGSLSLSRSHHSHPNSHRQIPPLLPHSSWLSSSVRGFCNDVIRDSDSGDEFHEAEGNFKADGRSGGKSSADPVEVDKVCKVIDELFVLDRNMEAVLDECGWINLSHNLVVDVLERFRHARKTALRLFYWAGQKPGFAHDSRTYNAMMSIIAKTRQFETMVSVLQDMGEKGLSEPLEK